MIRDNEIQLALDCLDTALRKGAAMARVTLDKCLDHSVATLNGETDRISRCEDSAMSISLFVDGRYGIFSTNHIEGKSLENLIEKGIQTVRMLSPDEYRFLPDPSRTQKCAVLGDELGLYDCSHESISPADRIDTALSNSIFCRKTELESGGRFRIISEEGEYYDCANDLFLADTAGTRCRHKETTFGYSTEVTIEDGEGDKYSSYWWTCANHLKDFDPSGCGEAALRRAVAQIGSGPAESGKYTMVVDSECSSKFVNPILNSLSGNSIQQNNSFLRDSLGKVVLPEGLSIIERPCDYGLAGSKLFDSEGVSCTNGPIVENGRIMRYFLSSYFAAKLGLEPTVASHMRPVLQPWPSKGLDRDAIIKMCGDGILVTGFNGGNCNQATGDFSYGIEGFRFRDGRIAESISGMLVTGNMLDLWSRFIASGSDSRPCRTKVIPTLAFAGVNFAGE